MDPDVLFDALHEQARPLHEPQAPRWRRSVAMKSALLALTTLAFVPILYLQHEAAATLYIVALVVVHVIGIIVLAWGVSWRGLIARPTRLLWQVAALVILGVLLAWAGKALQAGSPWFWWTLTLIWGLHTLGVMVLHFQGRSAACPVPGLGRNAEVGA